MPCDCAPPPPGRRLASHSSTLRGALGIGFTAPFCSGAPEILPVDMSPFEVRVTRSERVGPLRVSHNVQKVSESLTIELCPPRPRRPPELLTRYLVASRFQCERLEAATAQRALPRLGVLERAAERGGPSVHVPPTLTVAERAACAACCGRPEEGVASGEVACALASPHFFFLNSLLCFFSESMGLSCLCSCGIDAVHGGADGPRVVVLYAAAHAAT